MTVLRHSESVKRALKEVFMKKNKYIVSRVIHGAFFLINISDNYAGDRCSLYELNETGKFLWDRISDVSTVEDLTNQLKEALIEDVDYNVIYEDVRAYIYTLKTNGFLLED